MLLHGGQTVYVKALESDKKTKLSGIIEGSFNYENPLWGLYPADNLISSDNKSITVTIPAVQYYNDDGYDEKSSRSEERRVGKEC